MLTLAFLRLRMPGRGWLGYENRLSFEYSIFPIFINLRFVEKD
jgi:hypothetical protein